MYKKFLNLNRGAAHPHVQPYKETGNTNFLNCQWLYVHKLLSYERPLNLKKLPHWSRTGKREQKDPKNLKKNWVM